jgi:DNA repair protein RadC
MFGIAEHSQHELSLFHPSGDPTPSPDDLETTRRLVEAGRILDIELVDHIIIGHQRFVSLRELLKWE